MVDVNNIDVDVLVIGAGISGISASKYYLDLHPHARLLVLDRDNCVGGTWNSRRGYESFWTQWTVGTAEYSDQSMPVPPKDDLYYNHFKAKHTTNYLESYVDSHIFDSRTLRDRIKFSTEVQSVLKVNGEWTVVASNRISNVKSVFKTPKLIVASGLTSIRNMPVLPGRDNFAGRILHHEDFGSSDVVKSPQIQNITVLGAGKSSADMVYEAAKAGKSVSWIIKATNTTGPGFFLSPRGKGPYESAFEIGMTRVAATFAPSFLTGVNWWTKLLHSTKYGIKMMAGFWGTVDEEARKEADFGRDCLQGFEKLTPHSPIFWQNCTGGLLNHKDFFETIAKNVRVYSGDVDCLERDILRLHDGEEIPTDALLCGTGWVPSLQFFSQAQCQELGLPHLLDEVSIDEKSRWTVLEEEADSEVIATFPQLANPPVHFHNYSKHTPYRLYRQIVPLAESSGATHDRSIVFIGQLEVGNYFPAVECQSLWAIAYLDGKLSLPGKEKQEREVALFRAWCRRRYLSKGESGTNMTFELIGYTDTLLRDLSLTSHRRGWFKDLFAPFFARNFSKLGDEFSKRFGYTKAD